MKLRIPIKSLWSLLTGSFLTQGLRFGIRARFIAFVAVMFMLFAVVLFSTFYIKIEQMFVDELSARVGVQVDYLSGYGYVLIGNQSRQNLEELLEPVLKDKDLEYLVIHALEHGKVETVYSRFNNVTRRSEVLEMRPEFPANEAITDEYKENNVTVIRTAIPIYQPVVSLPDASFDDFGSFEEDPITLDEAIEQEMDLGYEMSGDGDLGGGEADMVDSGGMMGSLDSGGSVGQETELVGWMVYGVGTSSALQKIKDASVDSLVIVVAVLAIVIIVIWIMIAIGFVPLLRMAEVAQDIARGDLSARVELDSDDEIGDLAQSFNKMVDRLHSVIEKITTTSNRMQMVAQQTNAASEQVRSGATAQSEGIDGSLRAMETLNVAIREIGENVSHLTENSEESSASVYQLNETIKEVDANMEHLADAVAETVRIINETSEMHKQNVSAFDGLRRGTEETASSMTQIDVSINEIKDHSQSSAKNARSMFEDAQLGKAAVDKTILGLDAIQDFSDEMNAVVEELESKSVAIARIIDVIYDVADQTNLLALNASIIAAQAGEKGRSFAVVASQIKELSNRTVESIEQINVLIESVQHKVTQASQSMRTGNKAVSEGVGVAHEAGNRLETILSKAEVVLSVSQEIERSTSEHARGAHQVRNSTDRIKDMVGHIQANISEQESKNETLRDAADKMKNISVHVKGTTREQAAGSRLIKDAIEKMTVMVRQIGTRISEQETNAADVVDTAVNVRSIADNTLEHMIQLDEVVKILSDQIGVLTEIVSEFNSVKGDGQ